MSSFAKTLLEVPVISELLDDPERFVQEFMMVDRRDMTPGDYKKLTGEYRHTHRILQF